MAKILLTSFTNPYVNAATEEFLLKQYNSHGEPVIYLWQNDNTIVVGRNQNTFKEINLAAVNADGVRVFRRFSGGGTVYHDLGNLCYTLIGETHVNRVDDYAAIAKPIVAYLNSLGVNAVFHGRNDIEIDGLKISGNAQYLYHQKLLQHGTLLFNLDVNKLVKYLNVDLAKIQAKGIDSIRKRVTNIVDHLPADHPLNIKQFIQGLVDWFFVHDGDTMIELSPSDWEQINHRAQTHFASWEWNYGKEDAYAFQNKRKYPGGLIEINLQLENGNISKVKFYGDFLSVRDLDEIIPQLVGLKFDWKTLQVWLDTIPLEKYFGTITKDELLDLMFNNA